MAEALSRDEFAQRVKRRIEQRPDAEPLDYDPEEFSLVSGPENVLYLGNLYAEYREVRENERDDFFTIIDDVWDAKSRRHSQVGATEDLERLRPAIRDRAGMENDKLRMQVERGVSLDVPYKPLGEHLAVILVVDDEMTMAHVQESHLQDWGVSFEEAFDIAVDNLVGESDGSFGCLAPVEGVFVPDVEHDYANALVLFSEFFDYAPIDGNPVVVIPERGRMIVADSNNPEAVAFVAEFGLTAQRKAPRPVSPRAITRVDGEWESYMPPKKHPAHESFRLAEVGRLQHDYAEQKEAARVLTDEDIFFASYTPMELDGGLSSFCV